MKQNLLTTCLILIVSITSFGQHKYDIKLNENNKVSLTDLISGLDVHNKKIGESLTFESATLWDRSFFEAIAIEKGYEIISFSGSTITDEAINDRACCTITVQMNDSYGDGWNGGYLTIAIDGVSTNYAATNSGSSVNLAYCDGQTIQITYTSGSFEGENSYIITSPAGTLISDGPSPQTGVVFYSDNACSTTAPTPTERDCEGANLVCSNDAFSGNSSGYGTQELHAGNRGCIISNETQTTWYYINVATTGTLGMTISPQNGTDDYDFAIWGPFTEATASANCSPVTAPVRCNWAQYPRSAGCGTNTNPTGLEINAGLPLSTGACNNTPFVRHLDAVAGHIYILMVDNYSGSSSPYNLDWNGTAVLDCTPVVLPIELSSFTAVNENEANKIQWQTLSERNNSHFIIERSEDGINWENIHQRVGAGYSSEVLDYELLDYNYENTVNYYRLTQVDFDGERETFDVISIDNSQNHKSIVKIINMIGQEVSSDFTGARIILYSDGTTEKRMGI